MAVAKDVYEEGALIFPAVRIQRNYEHVGDLVRMMERRIRVSSQWYGDYLAGIGAARVAERRLKEMCGRYGRATVKAFINQWLDYSEQRMANAVRRLPRATLVNEGHHGSTPFLPDGIPLRVKVSVDPTAGMIDIDLRNNVDNLLCGYNQSEATATSAVLAGLFNSLESDLPKNAGSFRRVRVHLREGCVTGIPRFPHSCSVATTNVSDRMVNLTGAAFAQLGDGHGLAEGAVGPGIGMAVVSGADPRHGGAPFVNQLHLCTNGGPASPREDGWVTYGIPVVAGLMYRDSVEIDELKHPIQIRRLALMPGSGGAGRFRGAPGSVIEFGIKSAAMTVIYPGDGQEYPPRGVHGASDVSTWRPGMLLSASTAPAVAMALRRNGTRSGSFRMCWNVTRRWSAPATSMASCSTAPWWARRPGSISLPPRSAGRTQPKLILDGVRCDFAQRGSGS